MFRWCAILAVMAWQLPGMRGQQSEVATIIDSGSTNRAGFRIAVDPQGSAQWISVPRRVGPPGAAQPEAKQVSLPKTLVDSFYADLKAAGPLTSLPPVHCAKSVSFGSTLSVAFGGEQTPDLSCGDGGNETLRNLIRDVNEIVAAVQGR